MNSFGMPIHSLAKQFLNNHDNVLHSIGEEGIPNIDLKNKDRIPFYTLSYSFSKYLIDGYGIEKFMMVYESDELKSSYIEAYSKSLNELRDDWKNFISLEDDCDRTYDELMKENIIDKFQQ